MKRYKNTSGYIKDPYRHFIECREEETWFDCAGNYLDGSLGDVRKFKEILKILNYNPCKLLDIIESRELENGNGIFGSEIDGLRFNSEEVHIIRDRYRIRQTVNYGDGKYDYMDFDSFKIGLKIIKNGRKNLNELTSRFVNTETEKFI